MNKSFSIDFKRSNWFVRIFIKSFVCSIFLLQSSHLLAQEWVYTVKPGDNLWNISEYYLKKGTVYTDRLQQLNHIQNPKKLPPGSKVRIPITWMRYQPVPVLVLSVQGNCTRASNSQAPNTIKQGDLLQQGEVLKCGEDSNMTIRFADQSKLLLENNSEITLDTISAYSDTGMVDTRLRLQKGNMETDVQRKKGPGSRYQITTPSAVAAVRGTEFRIRAKTDQMQGEVLDGHVLFKAMGVKRSVNPGFGLTVAQGKPPSKPKKLLPPPEIKGLPEELNYLPLTLDWPDVELASGYRLQIADNEKFETLVLNQATNKSDIQFTELDDGDYYYRLRSIDDEGLEGPNVTRQIRIDARPEPPIPLNPAQDSNVYQRQPKFWWSKPEQIETFHFQLASDAAFSKLLIDQQNYDQTQVIPSSELDFGRYYWRIASYDSNGEKGPFMLPQTILLKDKPAAPEMKEAEMNDETINIQWKADSEASHYVFQFSDDDDFEDLIIDTKLTTNVYQIKLSDLDPDDYYFRIQTVNKDGIAGPFGKIQEIEIPSETSPYWSALLLLILIPILL